MLRCAHEQKEFGGGGGGGVRLLGVASKSKLLRRSWALPNDPKHNEVRFSTISTDYCAYESRAQVPRINLEIWPLLLRMRARGKDGQLQQESDQNLRETRTHLNYRRETALMCKPAVISK